MSRIKANGYTLIEVLIATAILSIVLVILYSSFQVGLAGYRRAEANLTEERDLDVFFYQLTRELKAAFPYSKDPFQGTREMIAFPTASVRYTPKGAIEELTHVEYRVKGRSLIRTERKLRKGKLREEQTRTETIFERVGECRFEFLYFGSNKKLEWREEWANKPYTGLPRGVRVALSGSGFGDGAKSHEILIPHGVLLQTSP